jgi:general secretion pathway protein N
MKRSPTPLLLTLLAIILAGSAASLALTPPADIAWLPVQAGSAASAAHKAVDMPSLPQADLALAWTHPLFSPQRAPDRQAQANHASSLAGINLTGVVMDGRGQWALLRLPDAHTTTLAVGKTLPNGWLLAGVTATTARFTFQGQDQQLSLPMLHLPPASTTPAPTLPDVPTP